MIRRCIIPALAAIAVVLSMKSADVAYGVQPINFTRGILSGSGFSISTPTAIALGPDGRLYVANSSGVLQALTLDPNTKAVTAVQPITGPAQSCATVPAPPACIQEIYGIAFDPNDASVPPPIYITNTISGFGGMGQAAPNTFPGKITKISGAGYATRTDIITGLPISNSGHEANGLAFGPDGRLYIEQGSSTNAGVTNPNPGLFQLPDTPLSGAILVADIHAPGFDGNVTYDNGNTYSSWTNQTGGFGVSVYAPGFRNPYGLVWHSNGNLYATDNGPNAGYGHASTSCSTDSGTDAAGLDELDLVKAGNYYGHANRNRGRFDTRQCVYHFGIDPGTADYTAPIEANLPASSDGMAEYRAANFGGQMQGDLLYAAWVNSELHRVKLSPDGQSVVSDTTLATGLTNALSVAAGADGTIYVAEYGAGRITFLKPDETPVSSISVTAISPNAGPLAGGQAVTITGTNFTTATDTTVTVGGQPLANVVVQNSKMITGTTPPNTAGVKDVVVTNSIGTATLSGGYTYVTGGGTVPPVANAGPDITTPVSHDNHAHVNLDGSASFDPDGFIASYDWSENGVTLSTLAIDTVELTAGTHLITLTVTDNDGFSSTDDVRVTITTGPLNPTPYFCPDVNGDGAVNSIDLLLVAQAFNKRYPQDAGNGYLRMKDYNADRIINSIDLLGTARGYTPSCPLVDRQIRTMTVAIEKYQNVNAAIADGYVQITQFIPEQGRHMVKFSLMDTTFDLQHPEGLLYEPDSRTPGGWRLGGAMFVMPIALNPLVPAGFDGTDDGWHTHDWLCFYPNGTVTLDDQTTCTANGGSFQTNVGWLLHVWTYVPNPDSRFTELNPKFLGLP